MTDPNYTAIALLVDASGSMRRITEEAEQTINGYIDDQRKLPTKVTLRASTFSSGDWEGHEYLTRLYRSRTIKRAPRFALIAAGGTALLDAIGDEMADFGAELAKLPEEKRPAHVIFVIMTDGEENSSQRFTYPQVAEIVTRQREVYGWDVVYLGANQDAIAVGARIGVPSHSSITYDTDRRSMVGTQSALSNYTASSISGQEAAFTDNDRSVTRQG